MVFRGIHTFATHEQLCLPQMRFNILDFMLTLVKAAVAPHSQGLSNGRLCTDAVENTCCLPP